MMIMIVVVKGACIHDELTLSLVIALRPQTPMHIKGGWPHYTDTSEPVDGNRAQNMVTVQSGFEPAASRSLTHELTNCSKLAHAPCMIHAQCASHKKSKVLICFISKTPHHFLGGKKSVKVFLFCFAIQRAVVEFSQESIIVSHLDNITVLLV
jgi:hypothetical protein